MKSKVFKISPLLLMSTLALAGNAHADGKKSVEICNNFGNKTIWVTLGIHDALRSRKALVDN
jgi:hypothetical protein